ncbi:hypothetical protein GNP63_07840 [Aliivibrio fischeri]|uniref:hypothetical protein n=1 Tax=Aliivibrio fischeri TaxID=668 RepID=UPI00135EDEE5|nr:hypothetical protein [Aliivibrio fischeri]MUI63191.1 hypothetical protein [Aliivibrio fischeri]
MSKVKKIPMFDNWGEFTLNPDFTAKHKYNEKLTVCGKSVINIPQVARKTRVRNTTIISHAIANNIAIPRQPKLQEGKIRGKSGESLFQALISGSIDMNEIEFDHDGWDFEVESSGVKVEVKTTAPEGGKSGNANLSQGDKPDFYVIFQFNNMGKFVNAYLVPVDIMKARTGKVPSTIKINDGSWVKWFEISLRDLQSFFELTKYYDHVFLNSNFIESGLRELRYPYALNEYRCNCETYGFDVAKLMNSSVGWWKSYIRLRASISFRNVPLVWCWAHK